MLVYGCEWPRMSENQTVLRAARPKLIVCQSAYPYVCHVRENRSNQPLPPPDPWAMMKISKYQLQVRGFKPWLSPMECDQTDLLCLSGPSHLPYQGKKENLLLAYINVTARTIKHTAISLFSRTTGNHVKPTIGQGQTMTDSTTCHKS